MKPIVRFAPSPTGFLHIGGARTALFNYLYAKRFGGQFVLRIEDTDQARSTDEATKAILDGLRWFGLKWDTGPFFQSKRTDIYKKYLEILVNQEKAYRCYCTVEELQERRKRQLQEKKPPKYDGRCRSFIGQQLDKPYVWRFLVPKGQTVVRDLIKGDVVFNNEELEDLILARADGSLTYNFVVVVDDIDMGITHVIRGDDHLNNTPKQILIYEAFGKPIPAFAHVPLILGQDKQRLSKRHGATSVQSYRDMGYLPEAMINFLVRLGWSHGDQEIFSMDYLIENFDLEHIGKSAGVFNPEKLLWLNQHYIKSLPSGYLMDILSTFIPMTQAQKSSESALKLLEAMRERAKTMKEMADLSRFYFVDQIDIPSDLQEKYFKSSLTPALKSLQNELSALNVFDEESLKPLFEKVLHQCQMKMKDLAQPLRVILTGSTISPGIYELMAILGKDRVLQRLEKIAD
ncbi:MAG: glutamate--tRNA ligase [Bdellovibrionales bacterium]|nr:glutamate--tRNA ligase [Bdellovibrionales bacterium]